MKKFIKIIPFILVLLVAYLYSCNTDDKVTSVPYNKTDNPNGDCPDVSWCERSHLCLNYFYNDINVNHLIKSTRVYVYGKDCEQIDYECIYTTGGPGGPTGYGSNLPYGGKYTRIGCVEFLDGTRRWGKSTFWFLNPNPNDPPNYDIDLEYSGTACPK